MKQTLHFHPFGAPCAGKSILAAVVFAELKMRGVNAEIVTEYAKELAWRGEMTRDRQMLVTLEQLRREECLRGKVDVIVTDSPPLLGVAYCAPSQRAALRTAVLDITGSWRRHSVFLARELTDAQYQRAGRNETPEQSRAKAVEIEQILSESGVEYQRIVMSGEPMAHRQLASTLAEQLIGQLEENRTIATRSIPTFRSMVAEAAS